MTMGSAELRWRLCQLRRAGFPERQARRLARDPRVDLHVLLELREHGCPAQLAARIVAPLDGSEAA